MSYFIRDSILWIQQLWEDYKSINVVDDRIVEDSLAAEEVKGYRVYVEDEDSAVIYLYDINIGGDDKNAVSAEASFMANTVDKIEPENIKILDVVKKGEA